MARKTGSSGEKTARDLQIAATKLFARHGYAAVSMRQIAAEIGVQAGALYLYTPDKQSLLFDLMHRHMQELLDAWQEESKLLPDDPKSQLVGFVRFHIRFHLKRVDEVFIAYMELRNLSDSNFASITSQRQAYENHLKAILKSGVESGKFNLADPKLATYSIIAMLTGINTWFRDEGRLASTSVEDIYLDMVLGIVCCKSRQQPD
ncbi:MAG: TetR/AcrR family transcriptional regulator [Rhodobacteraceae bacterium]|nr:TetR/AcrR family transcriptional regulator [Paracoccaceae bacterium]